MHAKAIRIAANGGPEVMEYVDVDVGAPGPGEILLRQHAIGLNFIDVYFRTGLYPQPLPGGHVLACATGLGLVAWGTALLFP